VEPLPVSRFTIFDAAGRPDHVRRGVGHVSSGKRHMRYAIVAALVSATPAAMFSAVFSVGGAFMLQTTAAQRQGHERGCVRVRERVS
jgi:hypothetical protein